jgi:ABC-type spermidine/putrescine transport system permease subunit II
MGLMLLIYWRAARLLNKRWSWNDRSTAARRLYDRHLRVSLYPIIILIVNSFNSSRFGINWQGYHQLV